MAPLTPLGRDWLLELHHGPTCAFKDVALQLLPHLMSVARGESGHRIMIVTATSGDTGKAALAGFADVEGTGVTVFYGFLFFYFFVTYVLSPNIIYGFMTKSLFLYISFPVMIL